MYEVMMISIPIAGRLQAAELLSFLHRKKRKKEEELSTFPFPKRYAFLHRKIFHSCNTFNQKDIFSISIKGKRRKKKEEKEKQRITIEVAANIIDISRLFSSYDSPKYIPKSNWE